MLCEKCGIREANIKYTEVFNGVKTEHNLCAQCAKEMDLGPYSALIEGEFPLGKLLSSLLGLTDASASQAPKEDVVCPTCGTTYEEFIKNSRTVLLSMVNLAGRKNIHHTSRRHRLSTVSASLITASPRCF